MLLLVAVSRWCCRLETTAATFHIHRALFTLLSRLGGLGAELVVARCFHIMLVWPAPGSAGGRIKRKSSRRSAPALGYLTQSRFGDDEQTPAPYRAAILARAVDQGIRAANFAQSQMITSPTPGQVAMMVMAPSQSDSVGEMRKELLQAEQNRLSMHRRFVELLTAERMQTNRFISEAQRLRLENEELKIRVHVNACASEHPIIGSATVESPAQPAPPDEKALEEIRALRTELATMRRSLEKAEEARQDAEARQRELEVASAEKKAFDDAAAAEIAEEVASKDELQATPTPEVDNRPHQATDAEKSATAEPILPLCALDNAASMSADEVQKLKRNLASNQRMQRKNYLRNKRMWQLRLSVARMTATADQSSLLPPPPPPMAWLYKDSKGEEQGPFAESQVAQWFSDKLLPLDLPMRVDGSEPNSHVPLHQLMDDGANPPFVNAQRLRTKYQASLDDAVKDAVQLRALGSERASTRIQTAWRGKMAREELFWLRYTDGGEANEDDTVSAKWAADELSALTSSYAALWNKVKGLEAIAAGAGQALADKELAELSTTKAQVQQARAVLDVEAAQQQQRQAEEMLKSKEDEMWRRISEREAKVRELTLRETGLLEQLRMAERAVEVADAKIASAIEESAAAERAARERADNLAARLETVVESERERARRNERHSLKELRDEMETEMSRLKDGFRRALEQQAEEVDLLENEHKSFVETLRQRADVEQREAERAFEERRILAVAAVQLEAEHSISTVRLEAEESIKALRIELEEAKEAARESDEELQTLAAAVLSQGKR